ncbi:restriction endonuclease [Streptomyces sp. NBC_01433]|uniref:restriction endonuclease n=1 Tax=Streptomyces sp. NBC_01433 TaxID=2903864 RepID=UPI002252D239|nr:restriction endonuclease [Streptomyces sp. NBC_01433]MCX4680536.1 restriction endonuclease [Streptomyces sp. NBC_01433]
MTQRRRTNWTQEWERQQAAASREQLRQEREYTRQQRAAEAERKRQERERQQAYVGRQNQLAADRTTGVEHEADQLRQLLHDSVVSSSHLTFNRLQRVHRPQRFDASHWPGPGPTPRWEEFAPPEPSGLSTFFGGRRRYEQQLSQERERFQQAEERHRQAEAEHRKKLQRKKAEHDAAQEAAARKVRKFNEELEQRRTAYLSGDPAGVEWFLGQALEASTHPTGFPSRYRVAFRPADSSVLVEIQLPTEDIVPTARGYTYVKSKDETKALPRPEKERKELYASVLAQCALRTVHEVFACDTERIVDGIVLNGHVSTVDRATGQEVTPCLITLSTEREQFAKLRLSQVDPRACLQHLNALVSPNPYHLEAVRPIIEFDLTKYRLMDSMDVVAGLDSRPVLTQLTPTEFEHLVRQLFEAIGMEAWNTQASKDEGVDAVAISKDPVFNGECVIQAKRYAKLVGVESVQALAGVVEHKRAAKGILITTSWFGRASHAFAASHGRLQLIEGSELVYLVKEHLGKDVIAGPIPPKRRRP